MDKGQTNWGGGYAITMGCTLSCLEPLTELMTHTEGQHQVESPCSPGNITWELIPCHGHLGMTLTNQTTV